MKLRCSKINTFYHIQLESDRCTESLLRVSLIIMHRIIGLTGYIGPLTLVHSSDSAMHYLVSVAGHLKLTGQNSSYYSSFAAYLFLDINVQCSFTTDSCIQRRNSRAHSTGTKPSVLGGHLHPMFVLCSLPRINLTNTILATIILRYA